MELNLQFSFDISLIVITGYQNTYALPSSMLSQQNKETTTLIQTIVDVQPRAGGGGGGETPDQIVWRICDQTRSSVLHKIDRSQINPFLMELDDMGQLNSLTTVLLHESERFNTLLGLIHSSLNELQKAIKVILSNGYKCRALNSRSLFFILFINQNPQLYIVTHVFAPMYKIPCMYLLM